MEPEYPFEKVKVPIVEINRDKHIVMILKKLYVIPV